MKYVSCASSVLALCTLACTGAIGEGGTAGGDSSGAGGPERSAPPGGASGNKGNSGAGGSGGTSTPAPGVFQPAPARLRRLTEAQYHNSVRDLVGVDFSASVKLERDQVVEGLVAIGTSASVLSARSTEAAETAAFAVARQVVSDVRVRDAVVACEVTSGDCLPAFVERFGRRAWRRPLAPEEVNRYAAAGRAQAMRAGDPWKGIELVVAAFLQSPYFLYRVELGEPDVARRGQVRFTDFELASRLSYLLWDTTPDAALLEAAAAGQLGRAGGLTTQAKRLLASPRLSDAARAFLEDLMGLGELDELVQSPMKYPLVTATLGPTMREEMLKTLDDLMLAQGGDWREAYTTRTKYLNAELGKLYGIPVSGAGFVRTVVPESAARAGLLGQAGFLAMNAHPTSTSPTRRGKFIRETLLCQAVPPPPPDADTNLPEVAANAPKTMKERLEAHRLNPACAGCHALMDPVGLGLENYDAIGAFRTKDDGLAIDASGNLDGVAFRDPGELGAALRNHPESGPCFVRTMYRYALGHLETAGEEPVVKDLIAGAGRGSYKLRELLAALVESDAFRIASASP